MRREAKRLLGQGLVDLALILAILRQSDLDISPQRFFGGEEALQREAYYDEGPMLGIVSAPTHHFQQQTPWEAPGMSRKYVENQYDVEYEAIMRTIRSQPPARLQSQPTENRNNSRNVVTMVLSIPNQASPWNQSGGGVHVARNLNFHTEGAVGGVSFDPPHFVDENLDPFSTHMPGNMRDDEIENLMLSGNEDSSNLSLSQTFPDVNWQQFIADYDSTFDNFRGPMKSMNTSFENLANSDILSEAMQSAELFLPVPTSTPNTSDIDTLTSVGCPESSETADLMASSRMELIEYREWAAQNHEDDLLFPSLSPPSYDEVMGSERVNSTAENAVSHIRQLTSHHMHDHNYHNSSRAPPTATITPQIAGYAIRSRSEISTRVITVPPRPRHISAGSDSGVSSAASDTIDLTSELSVVDEVTSSPAQHTIATQDAITDDVCERESSNGYPHNSYEIKPADSTYYDTLSKDVGLHREVILCN